MPPAPTRRQRVLVKDMATATEGRGMLVTGFVSHFGKFHKRGWVRGAHLSNHIATSRSDLIRFQHRLLGPHTLELSVKKVTCCVAR